MARKKDERNLRKFTFNISEENYIYLEKICENSYNSYGNLKIGTLLDKILTNIRTNYYDIPLNIIKDRNIALLEKDIEVQKLLLKEAEEILRKLKNET